jgi:hypothetical protein
MSSSGRWAPDPWSCCSGDSTVELLGDSTVDGAVEVGSGSAATGVANTPVSADAAASVAR